MSSPSNSNSPAVPVSNDFQASYTSSGTYPRNLIDRSNYPATLNDYRRRFETNAPRLWTSDRSRICVTFRDFHAGQLNCDKTNVTNPTALARRLGDQTSQGGSAFTKRDPRCRFIFISALHARAALDITQDMVEKIASYHQIPAQYLDLLFLFGQREGPSEPTMGSFWAQNSLETPLPSMVMHTLGRSGRHYEMCFNLKGVACKNPDADHDERQWSIRHVAVYHKLDIKERIKELTGDAGRPEARSFETLVDCFRSSLAIHLLVAHWAGEAWRWYIQWIETIVDHKTRHATIGNTSYSGKPFFKLYTGADLQGVQYYEEKATEVADVLDTNLHILSALREHYETLMEDNAFPLRSDTDVQLATRVFSQRVKNMSHETEMQISRAKALVKHITKRKALILQHMQAQNADDMAGLTEKTIDVAVSSQKEAIAMKIITVVTLVYLPATFVSTFFSTDVVKYQGGDDSRGSSAIAQTQYSHTAMIRWVQVTLPLTAVTLALAAVAYCWARRPLEDRAHDLEQAQTLGVTRTPQTSLARSIQSLASIRRNFQVARWMGPIEMTSRVNSGMRSMA